MPTAGNVFSCDLKNPVIFVCEPKLGGLKMCCGVTLPATFGAIAVTAIAGSMLSLVPLEEFVVVATGPLAVILLPSHAEFFATIFNDALQSERLRFGAIVLKSVPAEVPRIRFGLIVLIDVNNDNSGAAVDNMFVDLVCASIEMLAAAIVFLGDDDVARVLLIVLIEADAFGNVGIATSGFATAVAAADTTNPDATGRFAECW